jgi:hypothetical protein
MAVDQKQQRDLDEGIDLTGCDEEDRAYLTLEYIPAHKRDAIDDKNFAWPDAPGGKPKYPCDTQAHLDAAAKLLGHAPQALQAKIKARAITIAKRLGLSIPDSWKQKAEETHDDAQQETIEHSIAAAPPSSSLPAPAFSPKARIATLTIPFVADNAISRNHRQYPHEAVNRLVQSGQVALSDPQRLTPITCYASHTDADADNSLALVGKATTIWKEGETAYAQFDIADTNAGRDIAALIKGGYLKTMSLRASGGQLTMQQGKSLPQVGGDLQLEGIDFTIDPGLPQVAHIQDFVLEQHSSSAKPQTMTTIRDYFDLPDQLTFMHETHGEEEKPYMKEVIHTKKPAPMKEESIPSQASGVTQGMTDDPTQDAYGRQYLGPDTIPPRDDSDVTSTMAHDLLQEAHDHIAAVQGRDCAPTGVEHAKSRAALIERGKALSDKNDKHLDAAHDRLAHALQMDCEGKQNKRASSRGGADTSPSLPDDDDDDSDTTMEARTQHSEPASKKENRSMTPEEAAALLQEAGYTIEAPKTKEELLQAQLEAQRTALEESIAQQRAEMQAQLAEMRAQMEKANEPAPQRKSLVEGATITREQPTPRTFYKHGDYLREQIAQTDFTLLADRTAPLPDGISVDRLLEEMKALALAQYHEKWGLY